MSTPILFTSLDTLTKDEWSKFRKHLLMHSRRDSDNLDCFQILFRNRKKLIHPDFDEKIRKQHFPRMKPKGFSNMLSRLFKWFEEWFAIETFKEQEYKREIALIKGYNQKGLYKLADRHYEKVKRKINKKNALDIVNNQVLFQLYYNQYFSNNPIKRKNGSNLFEDTLKAFLRKTKEEGLILALELQNKKMVRGTGNHSFQRSLNSITEHLDDTELTPILSLTLKGLREIDLTFAIQLKEALSSGKFDKSSELYLILASYLGRISSQLWRNGKTSKNTIVSDALNISFEALEKNKHQKLLPLQMSNAVQVYGHIQDYSSTTIFINKWIGKVHTIYPDSYHRYCMALNAFAHDRYEEMLQLLNGIELEKIYDKIISAILKIIAYYKLNEEDLLETLIINFNKQLKRNFKVISELFYSEMNNLIKVINVFQKSKYDSTISLDLEKYKPIFYKTWVLKEMKTRSL